MFKQESERERWYGSTVRWIHEAKKVENVRWRNTNIVLLLIFVDLVDCVIILCSDVETDDSRSSNRTADVTNY